MNQPIETPVFEARPIEGNVPMHWHFHDIRQTNTVDAVCYDDNGVNIPLACQTQSLPLLTLGEVVEAALRWGKP
jgi:hypothetical protein